VNEDVLIPFIVFASVVAIVVSANYFGHLKRKATQETIRHIVEKTGQATPELIASVTEPQGNRGDGDLRWGLILIAVAAGFVALGFALSSFEDESFYPLIGVASFPAFVGVALLIMAALKPKDRK